MLNILKKKLASDYFYKLKKIIYSVIFLIVFTPIISFCNDLKFAQGKFVDDLVLKEINIGMSKIELAGILGKPSFFVSKELNCWCYCYYELLNFYNFRIKNFILYFNDDILVSFRVYDSYAERYSEFDQKN